MCLFFSSLVGKEVIVHINANKRFLQSNVGLLTALCALVTTSLAVNPIEVVGKDFVDTVTKDRFQIIGVEYAYLAAADLTYQPKLTTCFLSLTVTNPMDLQASMEPGIH